MNARLVFLWPDTAQPSGGTWVAYRHVGILNRHGVAATIVQQKAGFHYPWVEPSPAIPVITLDGFRALPGDVFVVPEVAVDVVPRLPQDHPVVVFTQNAFLTRWVRPINRGRRDSPYHHPNLGVIVTTTSHHVRHLERAFPHLAVRRVFLTVSELMVCDPARKQPLVAYMPRKNAYHAEEVLGRLAAVGALENVEVVAIHGRSLEETADLLGRASVFLSFGHPEGWALPPAEAMASGCVIVGYHGVGAREYWAPGCTHPIEFGDIDGYVRAASAVLGQLRDDPGTVHSAGASAAEFIRTTYPPEQEEASVVAAWTWVLSHAAIRRPQASSGPGGGPPEQT